MRLTVRVIPRSSKNSLAWEQETLKVHLIAPPTGGAANEALIAFLARNLGLARRSLRIVQGATRRQKIVEIDGLTLEEVQKRLE